MRLNCDFCSRFRILKGGKISLVVSALVAGTTISFASPSGESVVSGSVVVDRAITNITNINQTTQKSIINWQNFNINTNEIVNFNMPSSTSSSLNRVVGNDASAIYGQINSNGQVFLVNQNGIYFGKTSQVNTAGFTASTLDITDENFLNSNYIFEGNSQNSIINLGTINTENAYTALLAKRVENEGIIKATLGAVQLASGEKITLDINGNSLVKLTIDKGTLDGLVANKGAIIADGGEIYMTTSALDEILSGLVNNSGTLQANSIEEKDGKIILFANGGTGEFGGSISTGDGGFVETSAKVFSSTKDLQVTTKKWLIDPVNLTIDDTLASTIENALLTSDVELETTGSGNGYDIDISNNISGTDGDIFVNSPITWSSGKGLILKAHNNIYINETLDASGGQGGYVVLQYSQGTSTGDYYINAPIKLQKEIDSFWNFETKNAGNDSITYMVLTSVNDLSNINSTGHYVLGNDIDISSISNWTPKSFSGIFDGLGHTIDGLTISKYDTNVASNYGFFSTLYGAIVRDVGITNANLSLLNASTVGVLAGDVSLSTVIKNTYSTGTMNINSSISSAISQFGGLIGYANGVSISESSSSVNITNITTSSTRNDVGGLVGKADSNTIISTSYATGDIFAGSNTSENTGGLVGNLNYATISNSYATGNVRGYNNVGGFVGSIGDGSTVEYSFSTGIVQGTGANVGTFAGYAGDNLTLKNLVVRTDDTTQSLVGYSIQDINNEIQSLPTEIFYIVSGLILTMNNDSDYEWGGIVDTSVEGFAIINTPYLKNVTQEADKDISSDTLFEGGFGTELSPFTITSATQLANINNPLIVVADYYYTLSNDIDLSTVSNWTPIGSDNSWLQFTGNFDGNNHIISNLTIDDNSNDKNIGLFGYAKNATIKNFGLVDVNIKTNATENIGAVVGSISGSSSVIENIYTTGSIFLKDTQTSTTNVGGIAGYATSTDYGAIIKNTYTSIDISKEDIKDVSNVGGLVGQLEDKFELNTSYADGTISFTGTNIGAVIGYDNMASSLNVFYNSTKMDTLQATGSTSINNFRALTTEEFADASNFMAFNTDIWAFGVDTSVEGALSVNKPYLKNITLEADRDAGILFEGGFGTEAFPFTITSDTQLANINSGSIVSSDFYFTLSNDIDLASISNWTPIGSQNNAFIGKFDGDNHIISNLTIDDNSISSNIGLFGYVENATIKNFGLVDVNIKTNSMQNVGAVVANSNGNTSIENIYATGSILILENDVSTEYIGGLVGGMYDGSQLKNTYASVSINKEDTASVNYVGGLVGETSGYSYILNSYTDGYINITSDSITAGAIIGKYNSGDFEKVYFDGDIITTLDAIGNTSNAEAIELTTAQFANGSNFSAFDTDIWAFGVDTSVEGAFSINKPYLKNITQEADRDTGILFEGGFGTEASPFTITSDTQFANINSGSIVSGDYYFTLSNDIDLASISNWTPIGSQNNAFIGKFDGDNHIISNLTIDDDSMGSNIGLFGYVENATIKNFGLVDVNIKTNATENIGAVVGSSTSNGVRTSTYIENIYATGSILIKKNTGSSTDIGGLIGGMYESVMVKNTYTNVSISKEDLALVDNVGGFVGSTHDSGVIQKSYVDGLINITPSSSETVGAVIGYYSGGSTYDLFCNSDNITLPRIFGNVENLNPTMVKVLTTAQFADASNFSKLDTDIWVFGVDTSVEGVAIINKPYLKNITQEADRDISSDTLFEGGFGTEASPFTITSATQLANINNSSIVSGDYYFTLSNDIDLANTNWEYSSEFSGTLNGQGYVLDNLTLNDNYLFSELSSTTTIKNLGITNASLDVSNLGTFGILANTNNGNISGVYITGNIDTSSNFPINMGSMVGMNYGTISDSYSTVNITSNGIGGNYNGGIVGYNSGTITNTYYAGTITNGGTIYGISNGGTITNSYYDKTLNANLQDEADNGKTTKEMQQIATFDENGGDWDISLDSTKKKVYASLVYDEDTDTMKWSIGKYSTEINYTLSDIGLDSSVVYSGEDINLGDYWTNSIFGTLGSTLVEGTDYKFVYNTNDVTSFLNAGTYSNISVVLLNEDYEFDTTGTNVNGDFKIAQKTLSASLIGDITKVYDGSTLATLSSANYNLTGFVNGEGASISKLLANYNSKDVTSATLVSTDLSTSDFVANSNTLLSNYVLPTTASGSASISKATLLASLSGDITKVYDGTTEATLSDTNYNLKGFIDGEGASISKVLGIYNSKDVTSATLVTADLSSSDFVANSNTLLSNYTLPTTASGSAKITKATLLISANDDSIVEGSKTYSGGNGVVYSGFVNGETSTTLGGALAYTGTSQGAKNSGSYTITPTGVNSGNYDISYKSAELVITPDTTKTTTTKETTDTTDTTDTKETVVEPKETPVDNVVNTTVGLKELGFSAVDLKNDGYTAVDLKNEGFNAVDLRDAGFSASQLKDAGFSYDELIDAGFSASQLRRAGF